MRLDCGVGIARHRLRRLVGDAATGHVALVIEGDRAELLRRGTEAFRAAGTRRNFRRVSGAIVDEHLRFYCRQCRMYF